MAKITKSFRLALTPELLEQARNEAKQRKVSVTALIRTALEGYLSELNKQRIAAKYAADERKTVSLLDTPFVFWTQAEKEFAEKVIQKHFDEDR